MSLAHYFSQEIIGTSQLFLMNGIFVVDGCGTDVSAVFASLFFAIFRFFLSDIRLISNISFNSKSGDFVYSVKLEAI